MLGDGAPGLIVEGIRVILNLLDVTVGIERRLLDLEVLHELQRDSVWPGVQAGRSAVANGEQHSKDGLDATADNLHLTRVDCHDYAYISRPEPVVVFTIVTAGKCASGPLLVPTY